MQRDGCNYCRIGLKKPALGRPWHNYYYCPMCGKYLKEDESGKGDKYEGEGILKEHRED